MASDKCFNCEAKQAEGNYKYCLTCYYYNDNIFASKKEKYVRYDNKKSRMTTILPPTGSLEVSFIDILLQNLQYYKNNNIDIEKRFGFHLPVKEDLEEANYYFTFPNSISLKSYFVKYRGIKSEVIKEFKSRFKTAVFNIYNEEEWNTPHKYTKLKPCDCYISYN